MPSQRLEAIVDQLTAGVTLPPQANPWAVADALSTITWPEISATTITRAMALSVPACARGRNLLTTSLASAPLNAYRGTELVNTYEILTQPDPELPRGVTIAYTVDDLLFYGVAYWLILQTDALGYPIQARRVDPQLVDTDADGLVERINGQIVSPDQVIVIPGLHDGILTSGARELRTAYTLSDAARRFASAPIPALELHDLSEDGLNSTDAAALVSDWSRARESSGVGYTNKSLEIKTHGWNSRDLQLVEARAYSAAEIARVMGIPGALIDAAQAGTSLTYANLQDIRRDFADLSLAQYTTPIEQRLSMGDITPPGVQAVFDLDATVLRLGMAARFAAYQAGLDAGVLTVEEARRMESGRPGARA